MSRKAPRAALPKPKMHPPGLAITGGYTANHNSVIHGTRGAPTYSTRRRAHNTNVPLCTSVVCSVRQSLKDLGAAVTYSIAHDIPQCSADAPKVLKGLPGTN